MNLAIAVIQAGGPGSGCHGDNCGRKPTGKLYVSPNTKEGTHVTYALKALRSAKQKAFQSQAFKIAKIITKDDPKVHGAIGVWADGAENSTEIQLHSDKETQAYVSALLGKAANQKAVLNWIPKANGPHALYTITAQNRDVQNLHSKLAAAGINFHTIIPDIGNGADVAQAIVLDQDGSLGHAVSKLSQENSYETTRRRGTGNFIGSWDTREAGKAAYNKIINSYERKHGRDFARHFGLAAGTIPERTIKDIGGRTKTEDQAYKEILDNDEANPKPEDFESTSKIARRLHRLKARRPDLVESGFFEAGGPGSGRHKTGTVSISDIEKTQNYLNKKLVNEITKSYRGGRPVDPLTVMDNYPESKRKWALLDGHHRLASLRRMGYKDVPVTFKDRVKYLGKYVTAGGPGSGRHKEIDEGLDQDGQHRYAIHHLDENGKSIGHVNLIDKTATEGPHLKIDESFVAKEHRGKGIGQALYKHAQQFAKDKGLDKVVSSVSTSDDAKRVWRKLGAREVSDHGITRFELKAAFNPDEPRDNTGKWTNGPNQAAGPQKTPSMMEKQLATLGFKFHHNAGVRGDYFKHATIRNEKGENFAVAYNNGKWRLGYLKENGDLRRMLKQGLPSNVGKATVNIQEGHGGGNLLDALKQNGVKRDDQAKIIKEIGDFWKQAQQKQPVAQKIALPAKVQRVIPSDLFIPKTRPAMAIPGIPAEQSTPEEKNLLETGVDRSKQLGDEQNSSASYKVTFSDGSAAVFKPQSGECLDCRDNIRGGLQTEREVGAYQVAKIVGMTDMVAPTVARDVAAIGNIPQKGSLQAWQSGDVARLLPKETRYDGDRDLNRAALFDYVIGNTDRNPGNWLVDTDKLHLIDHGLSFPEKPTEHAFDMFRGDVRAAHEMFMDAADQRGLTLKPEHTEPYLKNKPAITKALRNLGFSDNAINGVRQRIDNLRLLKVGNREPYAKLRELDQDSDYGSVDGLRRNAIASAVPVAGVIRIYKTVDMDRITIGSLLLADGKIVALGAVANDLLKELVINKYGVYSAQHNPAQWFAGLPSLSNGYMQFEKVGVIHAGGPGSGRHKEFLTPRLKKPKLRTHLSLKAKIALANYVPAALKEHHLAEVGENMVRDAIGGKVTGKDSEPFDVLSADDKHAIEVKTLMKQHNDKITMRGSAMDRKYTWARKNHATIHTVVLDMRNGTKTPSAVYYRAGVGSYRIGNMTKLPNGLEDVQSAIKGKL